MTEMGEFLVGAWLKEMKRCDFIQYNARLPEAGLPGLNEVDVIGLDLKNKTAFLCEVTTHIRGVLYGSYEKTLNKIQNKFDRDKNFAEKMLKDFPTREYMFWAPVVPEGALLAHLKELESRDVKLVINQEYASRIEELRRVARERDNDTGNPAFRLLQILEHMRSPKKLSANSPSSRTTSDVRFPTYQRGKSCIQLEKKHHYVPTTSSTGGKYLKCTECGSSRTL